MTPLPFEVDMSCTFKFCIPGESWEENLWESKLQIEPHVNTLLKIEPGITPTATSVKSTKIPWDWAKQLEKQELQGEPAWRCWSDTFF